MAIFDEGQKLSFLGRNFGAAGGSVSSTQFLMQQIDDQACEKLQFAPMNWRRILILLVTTALPFCSHQGFSQHVGAPSAEYFSMDKVGVAGRIFSVASDGDGLIFLAFPDLDLVRVFDGASWSNVVVSCPISLATDTEGTVWVGHNQGIGYFAKNELNAIEFRPFEFDSKSTDLLAFYFAFSTENGVRLCNGRMVLDIDTRGLLPKTEIFRTEQDEIFVGLGGDQLLTKQRHPNKIFSCDIADRKQQPFDERIEASKVDYIIPMGPKKCLVIKDGFTRVDLFDDGQEQPFSPALSTDELDVDVILPLPGNRIGVAEGDRFVCLDSAGRTLYQIDEKRGSQTVKRFGVLRDGRIWLGTTDGFGLLDERFSIGNWPLLKGNKPATYFFDIIDDHIYIGADQGLFDIPISEIETSWPDKNEPLLSYTPTGVFRFDNQLFAATMNGVVEVESGKKLIDGLFNEMFLPSVSDRDLVFVLTQNAHVAILEWRQERLIEIGRSELNQQGSFRAQLDDQSFLLASHDNRFSLVHFPNGFDEKPVQTELKHQSRILGLAKINGVLCCWNEQGIHELLYENQQLILKSVAWAAEFNQKNDLASVSRIVACGDSLALYDSNLQRVLVFPWGNGKLQAKPARSWGFGNQFAANRMKWDSSRNCFWTMNNATLIRIDASYSDFSAEFQPFVRASIEAESKLENPAVIALTPKSGISFQFGLPHQFYLTDRPVLYQYQLIGNDAEWSDWSESTQKEYTNLHGGNFQFKVRAKDPLGNVTESRLTEFNVGTIWYLQSWFGGLVALAVLGLIYLASVFRTRKLQLANERMERLVALRTSEIESKTKEIVEKSAQLHAKEIQSEAERLSSFDTLVAGVAHDFNNLLTVISVNNEMIATFGDEKSKIRAENSMAAIQGAIDLCSEMTAFSDKSPASLDPIDIALAVLDMEDTLAKSVPEEIEFICKMPSHSLVALADLNQLKRALLNLVVNAGEAARKQVRVDVFTRELGQDDLINARFVGSLPEAGIFHCIEVVDDGAGPNAEVLNRIFDPFFSTKSFGRGLGLAIVLKIVGRHRGVMFVDASSNGTTFRVCLPQSDSKIKQLAKPHFANKLPLLDILVVDDDELVLESMETLLKFQGHRVDTCACPLQGLKWLQQDNNLDLLIVDVAMPQMTGPELAEKVLELNPELPILLVSGYSEDRLEDQLLKRKNLSFITKPYSANQLNEKIFSLIKQKNPYHVME